MPRIFEMETKLELDRSVAGARVLSCAWYALASRAYLLFTVNVS